MRNASARSVHRVPRVRERGASASAVPLPVPADDVATRQRILDAAIRLFAEHGFRLVTVRDICREAHANLAAVSYHFGDKLGLYVEVVDAAVRAVRTANDLTMRAPEGSSAEEQLRHYIRTYLANLLTAAGGAEWIHSLMRHELREPTPAARRIAEQAILPRIKFLSGVVAELLDCAPTDDRIGPCVMSIQSQCLFYLRDPFRAVIAPAWRVETPAELEAVADHVTEFSLAGIRARAGARRAGKRR